MGYRKKIRAIIREKRERFRKRFSEKARKILKDFKEYLEVSFAGKGSKEDSGKGV